MSSSSSSEFEVFLSFRGSETGKGFTSFLYEALKRSRIRTFLADEDLKKGDTITEAIFLAIEGSAVCIPVFSQSYADSRWCLLELAKMVHCNKKIIPIFYDVEPTVLRHLGHPYAAAFERHQLRFDKKTIDEWKDALKKVAEISGYDLKNVANGNQATLVSIVVERVSGELKHEPCGSIDPEETESNAELQAIEEKLQQKKDKYLMDLELHRKQYEMEVKQKMRVSSSADRKNLQQQLDGFLKQIRLMKDQYLINHMVP